MRSAKWQPDLDKLTITKVYESKGSIYHPPLHDTWEQARNWILEEKSKALQKAREEFDRACALRKPE